METKKLENPEKSPGLEKMDRLKFGFEKFRDKNFRRGQGEIAEFLSSSRKKYSVAVCPVGCLAYDTVIPVHRAGKGFKNTIKHHYKKFTGNGKVTSKSWDKNIQTMVRSYNGEMVRLSPATNFVFSGVKMVYQLVLHNGRSLRATPEHLIMTTDGWKRLDALTGDDFVLCDTPHPRKSLSRKKKQHDLKVCNLWYHPFARKTGDSGARGFTKSIEVHRFIYEAHINNLTHDEYKRILRTKPERAAFLEYIDPSVYHIHHKDGDHHNNSISNLECLTVAEHLKVHSPQSISNFNQGVPVPSRVLSVVRDREVETYDITTPENENFVANGIIVHNSGKTLLGLVVAANYPKAGYLVSSRQLQEQIQDDFPETAVMWGRSNFKCYLNPSVTCADCIHSELTPCMVKKTKCEYERQKNIVLSSRYQVLNYAYMLTEANYVGRFSKYPVIIADEGDTLENHLIDMVTVSISSRMLGRLEISPPRRKTSTAKDGVESWKYWAIKTKPIIIDEIDRISDRMQSQDMSEYEEVRTNRWVQSLKSLVGKLNIFIEHVDETWIYDQTDAGWEFKPVWMLPDLSAKYYFNHGNRHVIMSGTMPAKAVVAHMLAIPTEDMDYVELASSFPSTNRPVWISDCANMKYSREDKGVDPRETTKLLAKIREILSKHKNEKGVIHTGNWKINSAVMSIGDPRFVTHGPEVSKVDALNEFCRSKKPLVFVSPSSARGINLPDDLCRFVISCKAPFLSLADKVVSRRVYSGGIGQLWYASQCAQEIVQMTGRGVRHEKDWCVSYLLDAQIARLVTTQQSLFPRYWMDAVDFMR